MSAMAADPKTLLDRCDTLMLDMDGTLLDLAFDNYMWLTLVPRVFARHHGLAEDDARRQLRAAYSELEGTLDWYCLDHWSERLNIDVMALHRDERSRIGYLPGAEHFLESVAKRSIRVRLVTNSHQATLALKADVTGLDIYFDRIYASHEIGHAKEDQPFWQAVSDAESFDPKTTLFVDDNISVLRSAQSFGMRSLLHVTRPDTGRPKRDDSEFNGIEAVADLVDPEGASR